MCGSKSDDSIGTGRDDLCPKRAYLIAKVSETYDLHISCPRTRNEYGQKWSLMRAAHESSELAVAG
jgi:hypothetical protein